MSDTKKTVTAEGGEAKKKSGGGQAQKKKGKDLGMAVNTTYKNKVRALERHLKDFPNDEGAQNALKSLKSAGTIAHPRKKPKSEKWKAGDIQVASMATKVGYNGATAAFRWGEQGVSPYSGFKDNYRSAGLGYDLSPGGQAKRRAIEEAYTQRAEQEKKELEENRGPGKGQGAKSGKPGGKPGKGAKPGGKPGGKPAPKKS